MNHLLHMMVSTELRGLSSLSTTVQNTKESGMSRVAKMARESKSGSMGLCTKDTGKQIRLTAEED